MSMPGHNRQKASKGAGWIFPFDARNRKPVMHFADMKRAIAMTHIHTHGVRLFLRARAKIGDASPIAQKKRLASAFRANPLSSVISVCTEFTSQKKELCYAPTPIAFNILSPAFKNLTSAADGNLPIWAYQAVVV